MHVREHGCCACAWWVPGLRLQNASALSMPTRPLPRPGSPGAKLLLHQLQKKLLLHARTKLGKEDPSVEDVLRNLPEDLPVCKKLKVGVL